jgi:hypothetical protein
MVSEHQHVFEDCFGELCLRFEFKDTDTQQIVGFLGPGLVFTCSAANTFVYSLQATMEAAGAGHILLSIIQVCYVYVRYGSGLN